MNTTRCTIPVSTLVRPVPKLWMLILSISIHSFGTGRTTVLTGMVHLVVFIAFVLLLAVP